ncbi:MAG: 30S ribosome-binding factor RbfA [Chitinophagales bacterium]|nr:30S ribosome-binding factor RbfA [Chitinophagales bacterium]
MESIKQKQVSKIIQMALADIFLQEAKEILDGAMVSISSVHITPDLFTARVYIGIFNHKKPDEILYFIEANNKAIRKLLGNKIKSKVRRIPELVFFKDDSLDEVFKLEALFKDIKDKDDSIQQLRDTNNDEA